MLFHFQALPIGNRRHSRLETCATQFRFAGLLANDSRMLAVRTIKRASCGLDDSTDMGGAYEARLAFAVVNPESFFVILGAIRGPKIKKPVASVDARIIQRHGAATLNRFGEHGSNAAPKPLDLLEF